MARGELLATLLGHSTKVFSVALFDEGTRAISASKDETLRVWDLTVALSAERTPQHRFRPGSGIDALAVDVTGGKVVSGSRDRTLCIWDLSTGRALRRWEAHVGEKPHEGWVESVAIDALNRKIYSVGSDGFLRTWHLDSGAYVSAMEGDWGSSRKLAIAANSSLLVSCSKADDDNQSVAQNQLSFWHPGKEEKLGSLLLKRTRYRLGFSGDGKVLIVGDLHGGFDVIDAHAEKVMFSHMKEHKSSSRYSEYSYSNYIEAIAIDSSGSFAILGLSSGSTELWDLARAQKIHTFTHHRDMVGALAISPKGLLACSASWDCTLQVWELMTGRVIATFSGDDMWCSCLFAGDERHIIAGDERGCVHFLYLESWQ